MGDSYPRCRLAVVSLVVVLAAAQASASESLQITMSAPAPDCAGADMQERVTRLTGTSDLPARASVTIARVGSSFSTAVSIEQDGESRERTFSTNTCPAALDAAALVIAIGLFPERFSGNPSNTSKVTRMPRLEARLSAGLGFDAFALPRSAPTANLGFSLTLDERYWLEVDAFAALPQDVERTPGQAHFQLYGSAWRACYVASRARVIAGTCLTATLLRVGAEGKGVDQPRAGAELYGGPGVGALGHIALTPSLGVRLSVEGIAALATRPFELSGERVHTPGSIDVSGYLGGDFQF
jgi:hypothetical protein